MTFAKSRMRWITLTALAVLAISAFVVGCGPADRSMATINPEPFEATPEGVSPQSGDAPEQSNLPPLPPKEPPQYPNLDSNLNRLAEIASSTLTPAGTDAARSNQDDQPVLVTFYIEASRVDEVREYLEENGIFVRNVGEDYIEAHVPPSQLGAASERPGVLHVNTVVPVLPPQPTSANDFNPAVISQGVGIHGADAWHGVGFRGENVKVGVIDSGFEGFARLQGTELPRNVVARCYFTTARAPSSLLSDCEVNGSHGTTVAETLSDVAPNVTLYIANPLTTGDFRSASDWMTGQGVTVINLSGSWTPRNPGDGTSPFSNAPLKTVDRAVAGGAVFITSGGNAGRRVWYGIFADPDGDRWHNFNDQVEANQFTVTESKKVSAFVRWDGDWGREDCDLDLALVRVDTSTPTLIAIAEDFQDGSVNRYPAEYVAANVPPGVYSLSLWNAQCAAMPAWIQLFLWGTEGGPEELLYHSPGRHIAEPAEGRNPGMMAVGATHWWDTQQVADYSSRGPTIDGRVKPDITGVTCTPTLTSPPVTLPDGSTLYPTCGTSHASPHVAGLAALVKQRFTNYRPNSIAHYLKQNAAERGSAGADNTWGYGLAGLPDPPQQGGSLVMATLTRPSNVRAVSQAAGELTLTWEGGDNADSYVLIAVHMGTFEYETTSIGDGAAKTGTVTGLIGGENYLGIVVALQVLGDGSLDTLHGSAAPVPVQGVLSTSELEALFDVIIDKTERREAFSEIKEENLGFSAFEDMKELRSEFVASKTQTELYHALVKLSNARRDRHLQVSPVVGGLQPPEQRPCVSAPIRVLPDISDISSPTFFVAEVGQGLTSPEIGDVVVAVNDLSMADYVDAFTPWIRHSSLPGLYWRMAYDLPKRVSHVPQSLYSERLTLTLERSSGQRYNVSLLYSDDCADFIPYSSLPGFIEVMRRENFNVLLDRNRQIIFLQWRDFEYSLIQDIVDLTEYAEREQILDYDMIIDVTLSGGGSRGAYAIQRLVDRPFRVTFGNVRLSDAGKRLVEIFAAREPDTNAPDVFGLNLSGSWLIDWARTDAMEAIRRGYEYTPAVPFKLAHLPKDADGILQPAPLHFTGQVAIINGRTRGGSHLDQFVAMFVDNDLAVFVGVPTGGYSNTWEWDEVLRFSDTGRPVVEFQWSIGHTIRPNGEVLEGNPAQPDIHLPLTRDNFQGHHQMLLDTAIAALDPR